MLRSGGETLSEGSHFSPPPCSPCGPSNTRQVNGVSEMWKRARVGLVILRDDQSRNYWWSEGRRGSGLVSKRDSSFFLLYFSTVFFFVWLQFVSVDHLPLFHSKESSSTGRSSVCPLACLRVLRVGNEDLGQKYPHDFGSFFGS